jgi:AcrR family transcriptional regulator
MQLRPVSVRENKSARIKLSILNSTLELIEQSSFEKVHVSQICKKVDISKVTFFKYFPQKEDIVRYYYKVWCFHRAVELSMDHRSGLDGIRFLFDQIAKSYLIHPGLFLGLVSFYAKIDMPVRPFPLKRAERELLYPNIENINDIEMLSMDQLFENFLLEAIFSKEITKTGDVKKMVIMVNSILFGSMLTAHLRQEEQSSFIFKQNLELFIESLNESQVESFG